MNGLLKYFCLVLFTVSVMIVYPVSAIAADIPVLLYHKIADVESNELCVSPDKFEQHIQTLYNAGYRTISLNQMKQFLANGKAEDMPEKILTPLLIQH